jgi:lipoprotein-releasing system permease protein
VSSRRNVTIVAGTFTLVCAIVIALVYGLRPPSVARSPFIPLGLLVAGFGTLLTGLLLDAPRPQLRGDPQPWNIGEAIGVAWKTFARFPGRLLTAFLVANLPLAVGLGLAGYGIAVAAIEQVRTFGALGPAATTPQALAAVALKLPIVITGSALVVARISLHPFLQAGLLAVHARAVRNEAPRFADFFAGFKPSRFVALLGLRLLVAVPLYGPLAVLLIQSELGHVEVPVFVIVGLVAATLGVRAFIQPGFALATFYVVDADMGPIDSLRASWRTTRDQRFPVWLYLRAGVPARVVGLIAGGLGIVFTSLFYEIGFAYACTRLSARTEQPLFSPDWGSRYLRSFLRVAFVVLAAAFGVACFVILRQPQQIRAGWSVMDAAVRVAAVLLGVGLVLSLLAALLPGILDLLERRGFSSFVGARHVRSQKSGFLTVISVLSIFGVCLSSCSLSSVSSIMGGFSADLKRKILGNNAHIVIDLESRAAWDHYEDVVAKARAVPGVTGATPVVQGEVMVQSASNLGGVIVRGVDPATIGDVIDLKNNIEVGKFEYLTDADKLRRLPPDEVVGLGKNGERFLKGKDILPLTDDLDPAVREAVALKPLYPGVVIGRELAKTLHVYVGEEVTLVSPLGDLGPMGVLPRMKKFRVAAIFYSGMYEYDASHVYIEIDVAQDYFDIPGKVHAVDLRTDNVQTTDRITPIVRDAVARPELRVRDWREINRNLFSALKLERFAMFLILSIAIMVASFCIVCTLLLMVTEKGKEIAILKAMGASDTAILRTFIGEGLIIGAIGTVFGVTMALALCLGLKWFGLPLNPEVYYIDRLPINVDAVDFVLVTIAALTICTLSTIYPAKAASRIRPVDGLRYE